MESEANNVKPRKPPILTSAARRPDRVKISEVKAPNPKPGDNNQIFDWKPPGACSTAVRTDQIKVWEMKKGMRLQEKRYYRRLNYYC